MGIMNTEDFIRMTTAAMRINAWFSMKSFYNWNEKISEKKGLHGAIIPALGKKHSR